MQLVNKKYFWIKQVSLCVGLFCFLILGACSSDNKIVATVGESELSENDAWVLMKHLGYDPSNKNEYRIFVEKWCNNEVFKQEIKETNPELWEIIRLRGDQFVGELAQYHLEEIELNKKLDTLVSEVEIQKYYESHKEEFILQDYIVKALYLKIPNNLDFKTKKIHEAYLLKNDKDLGKINSYAKLYAENFYFDDSSWIYFSELSKDIPLTKYNVDNIVLNRTKTYFSDDDYTYFLNIIDYKLKDDVPPLEFLQEQIKNIVVTNRLQVLKEKGSPALLKKLKTKYEIDIRI